MFIPIFYGTTQALLLLCDLGTHPLPRVRTAHEFLGSRDVFLKGKPSNSGITYLEYDTYNGLLLYNRSRMMIYQD